MRYVATVLALASWMSAAAGAQSLPSYQTCTIPGSALMLRSIDAGAIGRLNNNDFNPDFVLVDTDGNTLSLVTTDPIAFSRVDCERGTTVSTLTEIAPRAVDLLLFDEDLSLDIGVTGLSRTAVFFGDGMGGASGTGREIGDVDDGSAIVAADIDGDGAPDNVVGTIGANNVEIILTGVGAPDVAPLDAGKTVVDLGVSDFDGDGLLDVAVLASNEIQLFRQDPAPPPTPTGTPAPVELFLEGESVLPENVNLQMSELFVAADDTASEMDLNDDGIPDLAIVGRDIRTDGLLQVFLGARPGTPSYSFGSDQVLPIEGAPVAVSGGDLDGDGDIDLVVADEMNDRVLIALNNGAGVFSTGPTYPASDQPGIVLIADVDADGSPDIAVGSRASGGLDMFLSNGLPLPSFTLTPTLTVTQTQTVTPTETPTATPTETPTETATRTPSMTRTLTPTATNTFGGSFQVQGDGCATIVEPGRGTAWPLLIALFGLVALKEKEGEGCGARVAPGRASICRTSAWRIMSVVRAHFLASWCWEASAE